MESSILVVLLATSQVAIVGTALANDPSQLNWRWVPLVTNSYGVEAAFRLSDKISISGFGATQTSLSWSWGGEIWTYGAGIALPDFWQGREPFGVFAGVEPEKLKLLVIKILTMSTGITLKASTGIG